MKDYVHRIGRTGRAGLSGQAVSFFTGHDAGLILDIFPRRHQIALDVQTRSNPSWMPNCRTFFKSDSIVHYCAGHSHALVDILKEAGQEIPPQLAKFAAQPKKLSSRERWRWKMQKKKGSGKKSKSRYKSKDRSKRKIKKNDAIGQQYTKRKKKRLSNGIS